MSRNGFTLVEMLVAVAIFGLIASAGLGLLSMSVTIQAQAQAKISDSAALRRANALIGTDLANAAQRPWRDSQGASRPAFEAGSDGFVLVRRGWENFGEEARASLQRVEYRLNGSNLERRAAAFVDGSTAEPGAVLVSGVKRMSIRFRAQNGEWRELWDPADPRLLPRALELVVETDRHGPVRQLFLIGAGT